MRRPKGGRPLQTSDSVPRGAGLVTGAVCMMVSAVPLALSSGVYESVFTYKLLVLHLCIALCGIGWLIQTRWGRNVRLTASPFLLPALCWMAVGLLSAPATTHPLDTAVELVNQAALFVLLFVVASALPLTRLTPVLWANALAGLLIATIGIFQYHGLSFLDIPSAALPSATFTNRNFAAEYLICALPLSGLLFLAAKDRLTLAVSGLSASLMGVFLVYTRTRSAWVGTVGALLTVGGFLAFRADLRRSFYESIRPRMDRPKRTWAAGFAALFLILSLLPSLRPSAIQGQGLPGLPETKTDVASTAMSILQEEKEASRDHSQSERLAMWSTTWRMVVAHPLLGVGPGGWKRAFPGYDRGTTISPITFPRWPHNDYLSIASEYGLIGLGIYLWFLVSGFRCLLTMARGQDPFARLAAPLFALSILAVLGDACFAFPKDMPHAVMFPYLLFGLAAGATAGEKGKTSPLPPRGRGWGRGLSFLLPFLFLLVSLGAVELSRRRVAFDRHYLKALSLGKVNKNWPAFLNEVQRALDCGAFRPHLYFFKGIGLQNLERYPEAEAAYRQALTYTPYAWFVRAGLGAVCLQQGRLQEALEHCRAALSICPTALDVRSNLALIYQQLGDRSRAEQEIRAVLQADPQDARAHHYLGNLYVAVNRLDSAVACYQRALRFDPIPQTYANLADVYRLQGRLLEALPYYQKAARAFPNNPNVAWGLGLALSAQGQTQQAEAAYRRAIALKPDFPQAYFDLGNLCYAQGRCGEAVSAYRSFLGLWRGDASFSRFAAEQIARCEHVGAHRDAPLP